MKYPKSVLLIYFICIVKIFSTLIYFTGITSDFYFLSIISIPICLAFVFVQEKIWGCVGILLITILIWIAAFVFALLGIKLKKMQKISVILITVATVIDGITPFMSPNTELKIICGMVSLIVLLICIKGLFDFKHLKLN